jgi:hypothetical protein
MSTEKIEEFLGAVEAVDSASENMHDSAFEDLVAERNAAARALAATPACDHGQIESKLQALALISSEREADSYGDGADLLMRRSIDRDLARLAC